MTPHPGPKNSHCPECGTRIWQIRQLEAVERANLRNYRESERLAAENGVLKHKARLKEIEHAERETWAQAKVKRQARTIAKLEARLRALKQQPYAEEPVPDAS